MSYFTLKIAIYSRLILKDSIKTAAGDILYIYIFIYLLESRRFDISHDIDMTSLIFFFFSEK